MQLPAYCTNLLDGLLQQLSDFVDPRLCARRIRAEHLQSQTGHRQEWSYIIVQLAGSAPELCCQQMAQCRQLLCIVS
jgi:hypothetical protein